ncbi:molybdopterin-dependent oxidoreductase [uncultured Tateyamaria sp.]|uniref:molybdopterin-dependent oxidoreductase n=1 Tax=uncultured Tateyamaria sp. TaxID=455651 RepID=UPI00261FCB9E|nr:molybdopterin-dependent oxidoreductase [uncultured Tateyamaria sp.]
MSDQTITRRGLLAGLTGVGLTAGIGSLAFVPTLRKPALDHVSRFNDTMQDTLFSADRLAPTYTDAEITQPFRYNAFYPEAYAPDVDPDTWRLRIDGRVTRPAALSLHDLRQLQADTQITRLICIEGWSAVGKWAGPRLSDVLQATGADMSAKYVRFDCADGYHSSIDMASALHAQTILALDFLDRPLSRAFGAPMRLRIPVKLGFKNAKFVTRISVTNVFPGGYWEDQGYNWFAGL